MQFAQSETIPNSGLAPWMAIRENVRGLEQLGVLEMADRTATLVGLEYAFAEAFLMKTPLHNRRDVASACVHRGRVMKL